MQSKGLSARTVRYVHAVLSSALKHAVKWGMLSMNPATLVDLPKQERREMLAFSPDQAIIFQEEATKEKNGIIFNLRACNRNATGRVPGPEMVRSRS
jgi:integrase